MAPQQTQRVSRVPDLRERRRRETRREIAAAALELFEAAGSTATTVDDIAHRAGVSPSTFFRNFATKEESVLFDDSDFEAEFTEWLDTSSIDHVTLSAIESIYERSISRLAVASDDDKEHLLRVRRLILTDANVRSAAVSVDAVVLRCLTDKVAARLSSNKPSSVARLLVETAAMTTRIAFDRWAELIDAGERDADLHRVYLDTRRDLHGLVRA